MSSSSINKYLLVEHICHYNIPAILFCKHCFVSNAIYVHFSKKSNYCSTCIAHSCQCNIVGELPSGVIPTFKGIA